MDLTINPTEKLSGTAAAPPSKSCTHRAVTLASLAAGRSEIRSVLLSADTLATIGACKAFGAKIDSKRNKLTIDGVDGKPAKPEKVIDAANSGTTLRIMTAVFSLSSGWVTLTGDASLRKRPMQPLLSALDSLGVLTASDGGRPPVKVSGPMRGGVCRIRGDVSSQFITGLLIATPLARGDTKIEVTSDSLSKPYIDLTLQMMEEHGGVAERCGYGFSVAGGQHYLAMDSIVEGDYSSAAFVLAAAALTGSKVTVTNLRRSSLQGDRRIVDILRAMGAEADVGEDRVTLKGGGRLRGVELDMSDTPDLVPITAALASVAEGRTVISNVAHLRLKESDRLRAMATELSKMGAKVSEGEDYLAIDGVASLTGGRLCGWNDHRIVMALAVAALRAKGRTVIDSAESIDVSYPGFTSVMDDLGADVRQTPE